MSITYESILKANECIKTLPVKGKEYATVSERINAFRTLCPNGTIETDIMSHTADLDGSMVVIMKATVKDEDGFTLSTGHAYEKESSSYINKTSYIENCETSAIGRALGSLGLGIEAGLASAEEMANAINQQMNGPEVEEIKEKKITKAHRQALEMKASDLNVEMAAILKRYNVDSIEELTEAHYGMAMNSLMATQRKLEKEAKSGK